jgi:glycerate dehydrogenase
MAATRRHKIVAVDNWIVPPRFSFDYEFEQYERTSQEEFPERVKDCTILIVSGTAITKAGIESAPNLELIAFNGAGTDHIDLDTARQRGVSVCRVPAQNADSVSEHAFGLYYAIRRHIVEMHGVAMEGKLWAERKMVAGMMGQPPRTNAEETLVVIGYGNIGIVLDASVNGSSLTKHRSKNRENRQGAGNDGLDSRTKGSF